METYENNKMIAKRMITISEAMQRIDNNANGILFLTDDEQRIIASITDGDIRRYLLAGGNMNAIVLDAANHNPKCAKTIDEARALYHKRNCVAIPILDENRRIVDIYTGGSFPEKKTFSINIPVVINAGGRGTRLDPYTKILPKPLIPVGELPILELIMQEYQSYDCTDFHIIVNYKKELIKAYYADNDRKYNITWYDEERPLGTGGGLSLLRGRFEDTFFFANCDSLLTANYDDIVKFHKKNGNVITMVCAYKNIDIPYGVVEIADNGDIKSMREKPLMSFLTNTGIYIVEPEVIDDIENDISIDFPDVVKREKQKGKKVAVYPVGENDWMDMGQLSELEKMRIKLFGE